MYKEKYLVDGFLTELTQREAYQIAYAKIPIIPISKIIQEFQRGAE